jgi:hypothetical protein
MWSAKTDFFTAIAGSLFIGSANPCFSAELLSRFRPCQHPVAPPILTNGQQAISACKRFFGEHGMIRSWLVATTALAMMTGVAVAQTSSSSTTSTHSTTAVPAPVVGQSSSTSTQRTTDDGVVTDKTKTYTKGTTVSPSGDTDTTRKTTNTTTVH